MTPKQRVEVRKQIIKSINVILPQVVKGPIDSSDLLSIYAGLLGDLGVQHLKTHTLMTKDQLNRAWVAIVNLVGTTFEEAIAAIQDEAQA